MIYGFFMSFCGIYVALYTFFMGLIFADWYQAMGDSIYLCDNVLYGFGLLKEYRSATIYY
jgi:hypothetical protein